MSDLDNILDGNDVPPEPVVEPNDPPVSGDPAPDADPVDPPEPTGDDPKGAADPEPIDYKAELEASQKREKAAIAKSNDERSKRQALESQHQAEAPDVLDDPEGYKKHVQQDFDQKTHNNNLNISENNLREKFDDVDAVFEKFQELAQSNPYLNQQVSKADPLQSWQAMYKAVKDFDQLQELNDVDGAKAKIRAEIEPGIRAEIEAEYAKKAEKDEKNSKIRPSLANSSSKGGVNGDSWSGPASLDSVLGN